MNIKVWLMIGLLILMLLILAVVVFLEAIDIIDSDTGVIIFVCAIFPPIGLLLLIIFCFASFHDLCEKHKDKIRKFLRLKKN